MTVFLAMLCVLLAILLGISVRFNLKHAKMILETEDALSEALDACDVAYQSMSNVLDLPVALNTPEVRHVIEQIRIVRDSVLYVSNVLAAPYGGIEEEKVTDGA